MHAKLEERYADLEELWERKMGLYEKYVRELEEEILHNHDLEIQILIEELDLILPKDVQTNADLATLKKQEALQVKRKK